MNEYIEPVCMHMMVSDSMLRMCVFVLFRLHFRFCFYVNFQAIKFTTQ